MAVTQDIHEDAFDTLLVKLVVVAEPDQVLQQAFLIDLRTDVVNLHAAPVRLAGNRAVGFEQVAVQALNYHAFPITAQQFGTRMVVTGDITQIDLPQGASGLRLVTRILDRVEDIHFAYLTSEDVVRHTLVGRIVDAYSEYDERRLASRRERDEATEFANRAERRRAAGPRDHLPRRGRS